MKHRLLLLGLLWAAWLPAQESTVPLICDYLDSIRSQGALLRAFFTLMPKGGDLHHHFEGSIYAETLLEEAEANDYWINTETSAVRRDRPRPRRDWRRVSELVKRSEYAPLRRQLLQRWSVLDYEQHRRLPPDRQFFEAFPEFVHLVPPIWPEALRRLKERARRENVLYLETILLPVTCPEVRYRRPQDTDALLEYIRKNRDEDGLFRTFDLLYAELQENGLEACAAAWNRRVGAVHDSLGLDDGEFVIRYQNYVLRVKRPTEVFADLALCFESAARSPLIVGVNIVAPEHDPVALRDYWLHMQMYRYLGEKYPEVAKALHAGELVTGQVPPEDLTWHIRAAVEIAGADRIGHGVDIAHESDWPGLLALLRTEDIPVEINLSSNAFILGIAPPDHPLALYRRAGVPLLISTDDAGVLRTDLTEQYVLLARHFPAIGYAEIKELARNSIRYSFIEDPALKEELLRRLEERFAAFETALAEWKKNNVIRTK